VTERLYRSTTDRVLAGVAGGLAVWLNLDPSLVRVAWVLLGIVSGGVFVIVYIVMMIIVPLPPMGWVPRARDAAIGSAPGATPGSGDVPQWTAPPAPATSEAWGNAPGILFGIVLILVGTWFLARRYIDIDWSVVWPFMVIGLGVLLMLTAAARGRRPG